MSISILWRSGLSLAVIVGTWLINSMLSPMQALWSAELARSQFDNSDVSYLATTYGMGMVQHLLIPGFVVFVVLVLIWFKPLYAAVGGSR